MPEWNLSRVPLAAVRANLEDPADCKCRSQILACSLFNQKGSPTWPSFDLFGLSIAYEYYVSTYNVRHPGALCSMPIWDHLDELRERVIVAALAAATAVLTCFVFSKDLVVFLEAPVAEQGVRFLQLSPGEFFFTTIKVNSAYHSFLGQ